MYVVSKELGTLKHRTLTTSLKFLMTTAYGNMLRYVNQNNSHSEIIKAQETQMRVLMKFPKSYIIKHWIGQK